MKVLPVTLCLAAALATSAPAAEVYPAAILPVSERGIGVKDAGPKVTQVLFAALAAKAEVSLVDREEIDKTILEQGLNISGAVKPGEAAQIGQLTGARLLISSSIIQVDKTVMIVAKIIGTETSKVAGVSVKGRMTDELAPLAEQLADKIAEAIRDKGDTLVAKKAEPVDRVAALNKAMGKGKRPSVMVVIHEAHVGLPTFDPAAETELEVLAKGAGFDVIDNQEGTTGAADVLIKGEGFSELGGRINGLVSVRARVEIKAIDRQSGKVLAVDRQTVRVIDLSEHVAGKSALQEAAAAVAERILPKLVRD